MAVFNKTIKKDLFLFGISAALLSFYLMLPQNKMWFQDRVIAYWKDFREQKNQLDPEQRKIYRWGNDYVFSKWITDYIRSKHIGNNETVLLPPTSYFKERKIDYHVPEPAVFYYYTGLKTVWINSANATNATWMVRAENDSLRIDSVMDKKVLADSIKAFSKYKISL